MCICIVFASFPGCGRAWAHIQLAWSITLRDVEFASPVPFAFLPVWGAHALGTIKGIRRGTHESSRADHMGHKIRPGGATPLHTNVNKEIVILLDPAYPLLPCLFCVGTALVHGVMPFGVLDSCSYCEEGRRVAKHSLCHLVLHCIACPVHQSILHVNVPCRLRCLDFSVDSWGPKSSSNACGAEPGSNNKNQSLNMSLLTGVTCVNISISY